MVCLSCSVPVWTVEEKTSVSDLCLKPQGHAYMDQLPVFEVPSELAYAPHFFRGVFQDHSSCLDASLGESGGDLFTFLLAAH